MNGNGLTVAASVFLRDGFHAKGPVDLGGASIGGQLACTGGTFGKGIILSDANITSGMFWHRVECSGNINLHHASVGVLSDDLDSWRKADTIYLNGFRYGSLESQYLDVQDRLDWLAKNGGGTPHDETPFTKALRLTPPRRYQPQPYRQLARAYDNLGHNRRAARVREVAEQRRWASEHWRELARYSGDWTDLFTSIRPMVRFAFARLFSVWFGYGHAPSKAALWAAGIVLFSILFYAWVYSAGQMVPNSDIILTSADWSAIADMPENANPARIWSGSLAGTDYETFSAIGYGIDLFVPLDALGQEKAWAPSKDRGPLGYAGFYLRWIIQVSGWIITAVGAATLTGLVGRK